MASIASEHETLASSSTERVAFDEVFDRIVHNAIELSSRPIEIRIEGRFEEFDSQVATPLSLVVTELIHNAIEHGLEKSGDYLRVNVQRDERSCIITVADNGAGLPAAVSIASSSNLGLQIVRTLTENELKGTIHITRVGEETQAVLAFPLFNKSL